MLNSKTTPGTARRCGIRHQNFLAGLFHYVTRSPGVCKRTIASLFDVLILFSLLFSSEILLKQLFPSDFVSGIIRHYNPPTNFRVILLATLRHVV